MKESLWGYWLVILGICIISVMILLQNYTTTNQQDYYLAKEITYAAMYDAVDYGYYKKNGELKIIKEKFVENFIRRFAETATLNRNYKVNFYTIYEEPPYASVEIVAKAGEFKVGNESIDSSITTRISALLEAKDFTEVTPEVLLERLTVEKTFYDFPYPYNGVHIGTISSVHSMKNDIAYLTALNELRTKVESQWTKLGITDKVWNENNVVIEYVPIADADKIMRASEYMDHINNMCPDDRCITSNSNTGTGSNVLTPPASGTYYQPTSIPVPLLHKLYNGNKLDNYFANNVSIKNFQFNKDLLTLSWKATYKCNSVFNDSVDIKKYRKTNIVDSEDWSKELTTDYRNKNGIFSNYDYYYGYKVEDSYSSSGGVGYEITPYYNACLVGIKYKVTFSYDES